MKVILLEDVKALGKKGDIVNASDGYARNMLFPKKLAVAATDGAMKDLAAKKRSEAKAAAELLQAAQELKAEIEKKAVEVSIKIGNGGRAFGSVSTKDIADAAKKQLGLEIDKKKMLLENPIRELGTTTVDVRIHPQVTAQLKVNVKEA
ncbi:MAG: 50S ribosomal protein L9 [Lachnospiraceae bacterium]|nr:50S ribosomal protein L9 [Lachnospiraceae bacterium]